MRQLLSSCVVSIFPRYGLCVQSGVTPVILALHSGDTALAVEFIRAGANAYHKDKVSVHLTDWIVVSEQRLSSMRVLTNCCRARV